MPELPEVETARKRIDQASVGKKIVSVSASPDDLVFDEAKSTKFKKTLEGSKVIGTDRRGKYFWLKLNRKPWPVFHFGMSGHSDIFPRGEKYKKPKSLKLELILDDGTAIVFRDPRRFGRIRLSEDPLTVGAISRLGFDPLFNFPSAKVLFGLLQKRNAPIKAVLLDQSVFAGIGNWIADEVLYQSKLSPHRLANSLTQKEVTTLTKKILEIVKFAVKVKADHQKFPVNWLFHDRWSKGRGKTPHTKSGEKIIHETIGGRTAAWVPCLQK
jgi:formamidopyrimidine-DNA glycosylase